MEQKDFEKLQREQKIEVPQEQPLTLDRIISELSARGFGKQDRAFKEYDSIFQMLRTIRRPVSTAPTFIPKNFLEMFQIYENGATIRLYVYVNRTWRYTTLT